MIKIEGTRNNCLRLSYDGLYIGWLDNDHRTIEVDFTEKEFAERFGNVDLAYQVADYYGEMDLITEQEDEDSPFINVIEAIPNVIYNVVYKDEEDEENE